MTSQITSILVPVDFSTGSRLAVTYAIGVARTYGAKVTLFHTEEPATSMSQIVPGANNDLDRAENEARLRARLEALAENLNDDRAVDLRVELGTGAPIDQIVSASQTGEYNLIVMGTHARAGVDHLVMGSVAEMVVRKAACPVLTVHLPKESLWR